MPAIRNCIDKQFAVSHIDDDIARLYSILHQKYVYQDTDDYVNLSGGRWIPAWHFMTSQCVDNFLSIEAQR